MNVVGRPKSIKREQPLTASSKQHLSTIQLYDAPPNYELSLDEFEEFALSRLKVSCLSVCHACMDVMWMEL